MQNQNNSYNNADSFAMLFDEAWKKINNKLPDNLTVEEKIQELSKIFKRQWRVPNS